MKRDTQKQWAERVSQWRASGLTAKAFADRESLNAGTLRWWSSRLGREPLPTAGFIEVSLPSPAASEPGYLELVLRDGLRLRVFGRVEQTDLERVLVTLGAC